MVSFNFTGLLEIPCSSSAEWKGSNTCDKLTNGTKDGWYKVRDYSTRWCELFETCFLSQKLRSRCLEEFKFFSRIKPKFTMEIISYLPAKRIQVNYRCSYPYLFAVNIIQCESGANRNGMLT